MDLRYSDSDEEFRARLRAWFASEVQAHGPPVCSDGLAVAATHGSPWRYDTFVPVIFAGADIQPGKIYREIHTVDVAPTLAAIIGAKPPSGSVGAVLLEVFEHPTERR